MNIISRHNDRLRVGLKEQTHAAIRHLMIGIVSSPIDLLEVVAGGHFLFRQRFLHELRGLAVNGDIADAVFRFFCQKVVDRYGAESASHVLDRLEVKSPPTAQEIEDAWVWESASSEDGHRHFYRDVPGPTIIVH